MTSVHNYLKSREGRVAPAVSQVCGGVCIENCYFKRMEGASAPVARDLLSHTVFSQGQHRHIICFYRNVTCEF